MDMIHAGMSLIRRKEMYPATNYSSSWINLVGDWQPGAWQQNLQNPASTQNVLAFSAVYACLSLISGDISKLRLMLTENRQDGTWLEVTDSPFLPVLRKPNSYQTRVQFVQNWIVSKLLYGNSYALKERDNRGGPEREVGMVRRLDMLDARMTTPLVADNGDVYYRLKKDLLAQVEDDDLIVPASEIIHDRMLCFWHPLVGVSPIYACGISAMQGVAIQNNAQKFFENMSRPSGVLTAPGKIDPDTAARIKAAWETNFRGGNLGRLAVMGDGLKYDAMMIPPIEAQLIEQLGWTVGDVARAFHVPPYKLGMNTNVTFSNASQLDQDYYSQCLQTLIESFEICMDEGLELPMRYRTEFDLDGLLRMDPLGQAETNAKRIGAGELAPNEARKKQNLPPAIGGDSPFMQQQNYSLEALAKRDAQSDPFAKATPTPAPDQAAKFTAALIRKFQEELT